MPVPHLVGRIDEFASLQREFDLLRTGSGRVVIVSGDPGVGKTRLVQAFAQHVRGRALVLTGQGSPLAGTIPLGIIAEPLDAHLAELQRDEPLRRRDETPVSYLVAGSSPDGVPSLVQTFTALRRLLTDLAADRPVVLILDDVHQADQSSWDLLAYLGRQPPPAAVLVIATSRIAPLTESADLAATLGVLINDRLAAEIQLRAFTSAEIGELAGTVLGTAADPELIAWLHEQAGGNPLFTTALLEQLATGRSRQAIPATVRQRVTQIRATLPEPARRALDLSAVLGHSFPVAIIAALTGPETSALLDRLVSERLLTERPDGYDFTHPLVRESVYEALGAARRRELHEQVGRALVAAPLAVRAYHIARGALPGDIAAVALLREAARDTARRQAHRETLHYLSAALSLTPYADVDLRRTLLTDVAAQAAAASDHVTGLAALAELIELEAPDPIPLARARMQQASFLSTGAADIGAAEEAATQAIDILRAAGATEHLAAALNERAWIRGMAGDFHGQLDGCRETLALATDPAVILHTIGPMGGVLALLGDFTAARAAHDQARPLAAATNDPGQLGWHAAVAHLTDLFEGQFPAAAATVDPVVDPAPADADIAAPWRTLTDWFLGRWDLGLADCAVVREMFPIAPSAHMAWAFSMAALFTTATAAPSAPITNVAEAMMKQAIRAYGDRDLYFFTALHHWAIGTSRWLTGDLDSAASHLHRANTWLRTTKAVGLEGLLLAELPEALAGLGQITDLRHASDRATEIADRLRTGFAGAQAAYVAGVFAQAQGRTPTAIEAFTAAAAGYATTSAPFLQARALERLARVAPHRATTALSEAARLYAQLPAPTHHERVMSELRSAGPAGRRAAQHVGALTGRERQVATLASAGLPTPEIAARLHLSTRTVETHLGRVYHKLGIDSRTKLADALDRGSH